MSFTVYLVDRDKTHVLPAVSPNYTYGTMVAFNPETYEIIQNPRCELNITYNYTHHYKDAFGPQGIDVLHDMPASEAAPLLLQAIQQLGSEPDDNYWSATPGNAGRALRILLTYALDQPDGVFSVDVNPEYADDDEDDDDD